MGWSVHTVLKLAVVVALAGSCLLLPSDVGAQGDGGGGGGGGAGNSAGDGSGVLEWPIEGFLIDCHDVDCFQRDTCNRRVLAAMNQIKTSASEIQYSRSDVTTRAQLNFQLDRIERLRSFLAPECGSKKAQCKGWLCSFWRGAVGVLHEPYDPALPDSLPLPKPDDSAVKEWVSVKRIWGFPPPLGRRISPETPKAQETNQQTEQARSFTNWERFQRDWQVWLKGKWEGWLSLDDGRSASVWFRITGVTPDGFVKACSDHGMVMGSVDNRGVLSLPRLARFDLGARLLLWRSQWPHYDGLQGLVIVEVEPGREIQNGNAWLTRALTAEFSADLTDYPCQSHELLDRRRDLWFPDR